MNAPHTPRELAEYALREIDREIAHGATRRRAVRVVSQRHKIDQHKLGDLYERTRGVVLQRRMDHDTAARRRGRRRPGVEA